MAERKEQKNANPEFAYRKNYFVVGANNIFENQRRKDTICPMPGKRCSFMSVSDLRETQASESGSVARQSRCSSMNLATLYTA